MYKNDSPINNIAQSMVIRAKIFEVSLMFLSKIVFKSLFVLLSLISPHWMIVLLLLNVI